MTKMDMYKTIAKTKQSFKLYTEYCKMDHILAQKTNIKELRNANCLLTKI